MSSCFLVVAVLLLFSACDWATVEAGCVQTGKCCQGKDNTCITDGPRENKSNNETCFCDSACLELSDCCTDYKSYCKSKCFTIIGYYAITKCLYRLHIFGLIVLSFVSFV